MITTKTCKACKIEKDLGCFTPIKSSKGKYVPSCKSCRNIKQMERKIEKYRIKFGVDRPVHKIYKPIRINGETFKECGTCHQHKKLEEFPKSKNKKCGVDSQCKECRNKWWKNKWEVDLKWRNNKLRRNQEYNKNRMKWDMGLKIRLNLSNRIRNAIVLQYGKKNIKMKKLLGCDIDFLKKHLELKFQNGMSWQNYGKGENKWEIDHIIPCRAFNLIKLEEQQKCFHYTNLQPLWCVDNIIKSDKMPNGTRARLVPA